MKLRMTLFLIIGAMTLMGFSLAKYYAKARAEAVFNRDLAMLSESTPTENGKRVPVLVELFTSEGCSSCPPADTLLAQLDELQPVAGAEVIALSEHVDYWNHIGWTDPYSSSLFSRRQEAYASAFGGDRIYTPQMIVDGQSEFVGSRVNHAREEIAKAARQAKAEVTITPAQMKSGEVELAITVENLPPVKSGDTAELWLAIAESNLNSSVSRGENSGRKLAHTAVVRQLQIIGKVDEREKRFATTQPINLEKGWQRGNLKVVAFIQGHASRKILGVSSVKL
jgi:hypothetical protein